MEKETKAQGKAKQVRGTVGNNRWVEQFFLFKKRVLNWLNFLLHSFGNDQCLLRSAALTYITALSIVPFLAVAFSISKGLGFQNTRYLQNFLLELSAGRETVVEHIIDYINRTNVSTLGAVGVLFLLVTVFSLLGAVEQTFNSIWGIRAERPFNRKFADYLSVTLICPMLIFAAISFTATLESSVVVQKILSISVVSFVYLIILKLLPFFLVTVALFFLYVFMPNLKVSLKGCLAGAVISSFLWQGAQKLFMHYQIGVSRYNAIYGSFAQLPLFLIWLYLSWIIVLLGAEIAFCLQNYEGGAYNIRLGEFNLALKESLACAVMLELIRAFEQTVAEERIKMSVSELAGRLQVPAKLLQKVTYVLEQLGMLVQVEQEGELVCFLTQNPNQLSVYDFFQKVRMFKEKDDLQGFTAQQDLPLDCCTLFSQDKVVSWRQMSMHELFCSLGAMIISSPARE